MDTARATFDDKLDTLFFKRATECTAEDFTPMMATNLELCFHLSQLAHPMLLNASVAGGGGVVHVSIAKLRRLPIDRFPNEGGV